MGRMATGEAAYLLFPKPRNFVDARYRLVSTWDWIPTDEDLFRTLSRGMSGSAMPSGAHLPEETRWGLVHYIKTFSRFPFDMGPDHQPENESDQPTGRVKVPAEPDDTPETRTRAHQQYLEMCAGCHGPTGKGDGQEKQEDSEGFPTRPRDLTAGIYKGSPDPEQVYIRIAAGLPGSPMPSHPALYGDDAWHIVHYVRQMSSEEQRARAEMKRLRCRITRMLEAGAQRPGHQLTPDASLVERRSPRGVVGSRPARRQGDRHPADLVRPDSRSYRPSPAGFPGCRRDPSFRRSRSSILCHGRKGEQHEYLDVEVGKTGRSGARFSRSGQGLSKHRDRLLSQPAAHLSSSPPETRLRWSRIPTS